MPKPTTEFINYPKPKAAFGDVKNGKMKTKDAQGNSKWISGKSGITMAADGTATGRTKSNFNPSHKIHSATQAPKAPQVQSPNPEEE